VPPGVDGASVICAFPSHGIFVQARCLPTRIPEAFARIETAEASATNMNQGAMLRFGRCPGFLYHEAGIAIQSI
jgi:hypothetical protein